MLNLTRLRVLSEVIQRGSFSAAADALDYTQSAVSQSIARLEAETGATLVVRDRRGVRPTAAGATLLQHADAIFAQVQAAEDDLAAVLGVRGGRLRVASFPSAGSTLIPQAVAAFRHLHPEVELSLGEGEPEEIAPRLRAGEFDLALLFEFPERRVAVRRLATTPLIHDPMWVDAAGRPPARAQAPARRCSTSATRTGFRPRPRAPARATSSGSASRPASSRASRSRATTTTPSKASSPPASASR